MVETFTVGGAIVSDRDFAIDTNGPPFATIVASVAVTEIEKIPA